MRNQLRLSWPGIGGGIALALSLGAASAHAQAEPISFDTDGVQAQGVGCRFRDTAAGPADAFVIANGSQVTAIFTQLGSVFRDNRRTGEQQSGCAYRIPAVLEPGYFISAIDQSVTYGLVKTSGIGVRILASTNYARRLPNGKNQPGVPNSAPQRPNPWFTIRSVTSRVT
jgi:hypothetical protein